MISINDAAPKDEPNFNDATLAVYEKGKYKGRQEVRKEMLAAEDTYRIELAKQYALGYEKGYKDGRVIGYRLFDAEIEDLARGAAKKAAKD